MSSSSSLVGKSRRSSFARAAGISILPAAHLHRAESLHLPTSAFGAPVPALRSPTVANTGNLPLQVSVGDRPCQAESTFAWSGGGNVLTISTVMPTRRFAAELISTYVGHPTTPTVATHLLLGPIGHENEILTVEHDDLSPMENARECAYDHAHRLIEALRATGRQASVRLDERSFVALERVG